jgi:Zn-dependent alcohol dehydrogenase
MRAAVLEAPGAPIQVYDDVELDEPRAGEVLVRVAHCGVCHSDLSLADGQLPPPTPVVLGHEASGVVEAVGPGVTSLAEGDHVVLTPCPPCGRCYWCVRGEASLCTNSQAGLLTSMFPDGTTGLRRGDQTVFRGLGVGGFAERMVAQESGAVRIPSDIPLETACVIGCAVQTGVGAALYTADLGTGATVLVMGLGGVGLSIVQGARLAGATTIIASDPLAERRDAAARMGATDTVDPTTTDLGGRVRELTEGGVGVDVAFDALGHRELVRTGIELTRMGGTTVMVGVPPMDQQVVIDTPALFAASSKRLIGCLLGSCNSLRDIPRLASLYRSGRLDLEGLVTSRRPLDQINDAFTDLREGRGIRTVIDL